MGGKHFQKVVLDLIIVISITLNSHKMRFRCKFVLVFQFLIIGCCSESLRTPNHCRRPQFPIDVTLLSPFPSSTIFPTYLPNVLCLVFITYFFRSTLNELKVDLEKGIIEDF